MYVIALTIAALIALISGTIAVHETLGQPADREAADDAAKMRADLAQWHQMIAARQH